jgi:hypothetical protein
MIVILLLKVGVTFTKIQFFVYLGSQTGGNLQNSPSEILTVSGFQNIEQSLFAKHKILCTGSGEDGGCKPSG